MCVISTGDVLLFGGIIDTLFSSQFWLLRLKLHSHHISTLMGEWEDVRLRTILSDEQIAINEHIAYVTANNNQIMMEVNNQENGDYEGDGDRDDIDDDSVSNRTDVWKIPDINSPPSRRKGEMPPGRWGHSFIYYDKYVFLYGGSRPGTSYGDIWVASEKEILAGNFDCWSELSVGKDGDPEIDPETRTAIPKQPAPRGGDVTIGMAQPRQYNYMHTIRIHLSSKPSLSFSHPFF